MATLAEEYQNLPDINKCRVSVFYCHNRRILKDGTVKEQVQERRNPRKRPFSAHKKFINHLVNQMSDDQFEVFFKDIQWDKYVEDK